jgi:ureidoacrylate peracid hydrolase
MHKVFIPQAILDRAKLQRAGREHLFDLADMSKVAHVIVDMQVGFVDPGAPIEVPATREIMGNVNAVSRAVRDGGGTNAFFRFTYDEAEKQSWASFYQGYMAGGMQTELMKAAFTRGAKDWELHPDLEIAPDDLIFDKTRFSGFIPGTCDIHETLQARDVDTLIISGTLTNCCCESTARDAMQMGYKIIFLTDGNATLSDEEHNATLISMAAIFADVMDTERLLSIVDQHKAPLALAG